MKQWTFQKFMQYMYGMFVGGVTLWIDMKTLAPTVSFFDSGELISAAYTLGVAHPPGYPLYVVLGWLFSHLPVGEVAYRLNLMSAWFAALASVMVYGITLSIITHSSHQRKSPADEALPSPHRPDPEQMLQPVIAMIAALSFAFGITHWRQAVIAEVYTLNAWLCGLVLWLLLHWRTRCLETRRVEPSDTTCARHAWLLYLSAWLVGLGFGNHQTISLLVIPATVLVLLTAPKILMKPKILAYLVLCALLGVSIYGIVPLRAAQNPPINWGNPTTLAQMKWLITREGYKHAPRGHALEKLWNDLVAGDAAADDPESPPPQEQAGVMTRLTNSLFFKQLHSFQPLTEFGYMGVALALLGLLYGLFFHRVITLTLLLGVISWVLITVIISDPSPDNIFLVQEFHTPAYLLMAVWIGLGATAIARGVLWVAPTHHTFQYIAVFGLAIYVLVLPAHLLLKNLRIVDRRQNYVAYDYANNVLKSLKPQAILFTWGDSGAFPLWYLQIVEYQRPDVTLIHVPHLGSTWYVDALPSDLFISADPSEQYQGDLLLILGEIVQKNLASRPIYFDYSSAHSLHIPYELLPSGITYKIAARGEQLEEGVWERYRFRGILDNTRIALDPDIKRTFLMYGSAHIELGHYYLQEENLEKAAEHFNLAVQFDPSLGDRIVRDLEFRNKLFRGGREAGPLPQDQEPPDSEDQP